jgi:hypothetical protein
MSLKLKGLVVGARVTPENELMGFYMFSNTVTVGAKSYVVRSLVGGSSFSQTTTVGFSGNTSSFAVSVSATSVTVPATFSAAGSASGSFSAQFTVTGVASITLLTISAYNSAAAGSPYLTATVSVVLNSGDTFGVQWNVSAT